METFHRVPVLHHHHHLENNDSLTRQQVILPARRRRRRRRPFIPLLVRPQTVGLLEDILHQVLLTMALQLLQHIQIMVPRQ
jgi:hypothetical protein